jgi:hypothetical protein
MTDFMDWGQIVQRPSILLAGNLRVKTPEEFLRRHRENSGGAAVASSCGILTTGMVQIGYSR